MLCLMLGACAQAPKLGPQVAGLPSQVELDNVPFFPQDAYQCGPAALATMLVQRDIEITPEQLVPRVYLPGRKGSLQLELVAAARAEGQLVYPLQPRIEDLLAEVAAGNPVLVLQNLGGSWWPVWHFAVVVGYDLNEGTLVLRSGEKRRQIHKLRYFQSTWTKAQRWAVVTVPADRLPATARTTDWLRAASDLEQVGQTEAAVTAYRSAIGKWPEDGLASFALANTEFAAGDPAAAEQSLRESLKRSPKLAPAWYNLGQLLGQQGCAESAAAAVQCARRLAPEDSRFGAEAASGSTGSGQCRVLPACPL
jgi:tetratricopeptide (TPR) repeat protein